MNKNKSEQYRNESDLILLKILLFGSISMIGLLIRISKIFFNFSKFFLLRFKSFIFFLNILSLLNILCVLKLLIRIGYIFPYQENLKNNKLLFL